MKIKTIYLVTSNNVVTGGVEATYQLYYILKQLNKNVKILLITRTKKYWELYFYV